MTPPELRRGVRYEVQLPCQVESPFHAFQQLSGTTVNMSRNGLLLSVEKDETEGSLPEVGHAARILLELPAGGASRGRCVECLGRVVRVNGPNPWTQVAFEFRRFQFTEFSPDSAD